MSVFSYNGINLPYPITTSFTNDVVYEESNTDWFCTRYDITVQCTIYAEYLSTIAADLAAANVNGKFSSPAAIIATIRNRLMKPRQRLSMKFDGAELIPEAQTGNTGTVDARNGPQPQSCTYLNMTNTSWLMTFRIIAHYWENNGASATNLIGGTKNKNLPGDTVLYNRWSETVSMDASMYTTRSRTGKYMIRSDNVSGVMADAMRKQMAVLRVPDRCVRMKSSYTQSEDGLSISYNFEDKEVFNMPPAPAFEATGSYTEVYPKPGGVERLGMVKVRLRAPRNVAQIRVMQAAVIIAVRAIVDNNQGRGTTGVDVASPIIRDFGTVQNITLIRDLFDNVVEVQVTSLLRPLETSPLAFFDQMFRPPTNNNRRIPYDPLGTLGYLMQAAAYYDPSIRGHRIDVNTPPGNQITPAAEGVPGTTGQNPPE